MLARRSVLKAWAIAPSSEEASIEIMELNFDIVDLVAACLEVSRPIRATAQRHTTFVEVVFTSTAIAAKKMMLATLCDGQCCDLICV